ncbi:predicted protein [Nematostella vectensis]|uniref:F5/8 type C domain-containing protein n=1 Tax=Nematostella vectensis TaxID=45351 RepID=A7SS92_NEMVE|nr:predicted protein [Nematostella vectensis]|eukprot:XP_001625517.1 predicted protein [Nematostella vectensis]
MQLTKILTIAILTAFYDKLNADESKRTYIVPSTWQGRTDWGRAELISEKDSEVVVKLTDDPTGQPRMFSKHDIAVGEVLKDRDAMIGMEVLAHVGHDLSKKPFYAKGTITSRVRPSQFTVQPSCAEKLMPIGVGVKLPPSRLKPIPDEQFKASSEYPGLPARNGRLGNGKAWCPARKKMRNAWLQIDLCAPYYLCSVVAQGETVKMSEWVEAFTIAVSNDGMTFSSLKDENGNVKSSRDGTESILGLKLPYRYVRFFPGAYHNYPCLSVELYGVGPTRSTKSSQEFKADELFAVGDPLAPYLLVPSTWKDRVDWKLARLISHRGSDVYVKIPMVAGPPVRFSSTEVLLNVPPKSDLPVGVPVFAPFAKDKNNVVMYSEGRVTLNQGGKYFVSPFCSSLKKSLPLGVAIQSTLPVERVTSLPDSKLSATSESSSSHPAKNGRLGNTLVWCAAEGSFSSSSFTVDLGGLYHVCSVAVQGNLHDKNEFVTSFKIAMSTDGRRWTVIQDRQRNQLFKRNGKEPVEVHLAAQDSYRIIDFDEQTYLVVYIGNSGDKLVFDLLPSPASNASYKPNRESDLARGSTHANGSEKHCACAVHGLEQSDPYYCNYRNVFHIMKRAVLVIMNEPRFIDKRRVEAPLKSYLHEKALEVK